MLLALAAVLFFAARHPRFASTARVFAGTRPLPSARAAGVDFQPVLGHDASAAERAPARKPAAVAPRLVIEPISADENM